MFSLQGEIIKVMMDICDVLPSTVKKEVHTIPTIITV